MDKLDVVALLSVLASVFTAIMAGLTFQSQQQTKTLTDVVSGMDSQLKEMEKQTKVLTDQFLLNSQLATPSLAPYFTFKQLVRSWSTLEYPTFTYSLELVNKGTRAVKVKTAISPNEVVKVWGEQTFIEGQSNFVLTVTPNKWQEPCPNFYLLNIMYADEYGNEFIQMVSHENDLITVSKPATLSNA